MDSYIAIIVKLSHQDSWLLLLVGRGGRKTLTPSISLLVGATIISESIGIVSLRAL